MRETKRLKLLHLRQLCNRFLGWCRSSFLRRASYPNDLQGVVGLRSGDGSVRSIEGGFDEHSQDIAELTPRDQQID